MMQQRRHVFNICTSHQNCCCHFRGGWWVPPFPLFFFSFFFFFFFLLTKGSSWTVFSFWRPGQLICRPSLLPLWPPFLPHPFSFFPPSSVRQRPHHPTQEKCSCLFVHFQTTVYLTLHRPGITALWRTTVWCWYHHHRNAEFSVTLDIWTCPPQTTDSQRTLEIEKGLRVPRFLSFSK